MEKLARCIVLQHKELLCRCNTVQHDSILEVNFAGTHSRSEIRVLPHEQFQARKGCLVIMSSACLQNYLKIQGIDGWTLAILLLPSQFFSYIPSNRNLPIVFNVPFSGNSTQKNLKSFHLQHSFFFFFAFFGFVLSSTCQQVKRGKQPKYSV